MDVLPPLFKKLPQMLENVLQLVHFRVGEYPVKGHGLVRAALRTVRA